MKEINELNIPADFYYTEDHEWASRQGDNLRIGISDYAQDQLGEIVYVELPQPGDFFEKGTVFGTVESVKAVSEVYMPVTGEIQEINETLEDNPEFLNHDPYGKGWMVSIKPSDASDINTLMNAEVYLNKLRGTE